MFPTWICIRITPAKTTIKKVRIIIWLGAEKTKFINVGIVNINRFDKRGSTVAIAFIKGQWWFTNALATSTAASLFSGFILKKRKHIYWPTFDMKLYECHLVRVSFIQNNSKFRLVTRKTTCQSLIKLKFEGSCNARNGCKSSKTLSKFLLDFVTKFHYS